MIIAFDDMITNMEANKKKLETIATELFIAGGKSNVSLASDHNT